MSRKTVLITGASRGIGKAIALEFARHNYNVVITCVRSMDRLEQVKREIEAFHVSCLAMQCDAGSMDQCRTLFTWIRQQFGHIDVLVNNAGISYIGLLQDMSGEDWDHIFQTNVTSVFNLSKLAIPDMVARKQGKIINISSVWGQAGASCEVAYSATKGAVDAFTKALAKELAPSSIQVNAVSCGAIETEMNHFLEESEKQELAEEIPVGRFGHPEEVAELVFQLAQANPYLTGQIIKIDGGWI